MLIPKNLQEPEENEDKQIKSLDMYFKEPIKVQLTKEQLEKPFDKLNLSGNRELE